MPSSSRTQSIKASLASPIHMIDLPMTERRAQLIPSHQEAMDILCAIQDKPFIYRAYYFLAMYTGCRRGELAALRWTDFTVQEDGSALLTISRSRSSVPGKGVQEGKTKNGRSRSIFIMIIATRKTIEL